MKSKGELKDDDIQEQVSAVLNFSQFDKPVAAGSRKGKPVDQLAINRRRALFLLTIRDTLQRANIDAIEADPAESDASQGVCLFLDFASD